MSNSQVLTIGVDCDDVLMPCMELALQRVNERLGTNHKVEEITDWNFSTLPENVRCAIYEEFSDPKFYEDQIFYPGAINFVRELQTIGRVIIVTASYAIALTSRKLKFERELPGIKMIFAEDKDLVGVDILIDDGMHNILKTKAKFPIIFDRAWNREGRGLRVHSYEETLRVVRSIADGSTPQSLMRHPASKWDGNQKLLLCLIGPSGAGKTAICDKIVACDSRIGRPVTTTTRAKRPNEIDGVHYNFISREEFEQGLRKGRFYEYTVYANNYYGTDKASRSIERVWESGRHALIPIDITGALQMKKIYKDRCVLIFVLRKTTEVIRSILDRKIPEEEKIARIEQLPREFACESLCDMTLENNGTIEEAVKKLQAVIAN